MDNLAKFCQQFQKKGNKLKYATDIAGLFCNTFITKGYH